jgi:hypothetical protein
MVARHVFVETNWVVDCFAPAHFAIPSARALLSSAQRGTLSLHVPGICLTEGRTVIRRKFQPRNQADPLRNYVRWAKVKNEIKPEAEQIVRHALDQYERVILAELQALDEAFDRLKNEEGVEVFPLTESMLELALSPAAERLGLHPFDHAILPAVLIRASEIKQHNADAELFFCELDGNLQPWDKYGRIKSDLAQLYDNAHIWVYGDFEMTSPARPDEWAK